MILTRYNLSKITTQNVSIPDDHLFELPEKVLQFGTGVLLRALPDYYIHEANKQGIFNGRIVVVKSTEGGLLTAFDRQDGLYTVHVKGLANGEQVNQQIINSSISRVLSASKDWDTVLKAAHSPHLQIIISNTTEVGIELIQDDITKHPPESFPGKLLALLYERYKAFSGSSKCGVVIIPTELITDNGRKLEAIVLELAHLNKLEPAFMDWLESSNQFCNSLVDRIVPGKPQASLFKQLEESSGYNDELRIIAEPYSLWAIQGNDKVRSVLSFSAVDSGIVITPNIEIYRELKLRLLNGTHTLTCAIAILSGFKTVKEAMDHQPFLRFVKYLMSEEIAPAMSRAIDEHAKKEFITVVLDRFRNEDIEHQWLSIAVQYSSKFKLRVLPLLLDSYKASGYVPDGFIFSFASFILLMGNAAATGAFTNKTDREIHVFTDNNADVFAKAWHNNSPDEAVSLILKDTALWDTDLSALSGLQGALLQKVKLMMSGGAMQLLEDFEPKSLLK